MEVAMDGGDLLCCQSGTKEQWKGREGASGRKLELSHPGSWLCSQFRFNKTADTVSETSVGSGQTVSALLHLHYPGQ